MKAEDKIIEYLLDAHAKETALVQTLTAHLKVTEPSSYKTLIEEHRDETIEHATLIQERLVELGGHRKPVALAHAAMQNIITNSLSMAKAPVDLLRGKSVSEKMLKNARDEAMTEAAEIACYDSLEQLAKRVGDRKTATLARRIRGDEVKMLAALRKEIPALTDAVVESQIPKGELQNA